MHCLVVLLALAAPRLAMIAIFLFTSWFERAYETTIWPLLGFVFMPYTTLAYLAAMLGNEGVVSGWWVALLIAAVAVDLGVGSSAGRGPSRGRRSEKVKAAP